MSDFFRRHSLFLTTLALLLCSLQLMSLSLANKAVPQAGARAVDAVLSPLEKGYHELFQSAKYIWNHYLWLLNVETERNQLVNRVKELEAHNSRLMEFDSENQRLRRILNFKDRSGFTGVVASVVGRDPSNWVKSITIDRGSDDGLKEGYAVVDGNAIVGQTITVNRHSSRVLLLTDNSSAVDAIVQSSRAAGTAEGGLGRSSLRLRYVLKLKEFEVNVGDRVIASGLDGVFPKGALIGVVGKVNPQAKGWFQDIEVEPSVDVYRLENVLVMIPGATNAEIALEAPALTDPAASRPAEADAPEAPSRDTPSRGAP